MKRFWRQLDQEYFQEINVDSALESLDDLIHSVNLAAGGGSPLLSDENLTMSGADIEASFRAQSGGWAHQSSSGAEQERTQRPWKKRGMLHCSEIEESTGALGFLPFEEAGSLQKGK